MMHSRIGAIAEMRNRRDSDTLRDVQKRMKIRMETGSQASSFVAAYYFFQMFYFLFGEVMLVPRDTRTYIQQYMMEVL